MFSYKGKLKAIQRFVYKNGFIKIEDFNGKQTLYKEGREYFSADKIKIFDSLILKNENEIFHLFDYEGNSIINNLKGLFVLKNEKHILTENISGIYSVYDIENKNIIEENETPFEVIGDSLYFENNKEFFLLNYEKNRIFKLKGRPTYFEIYDRGIYYTTKKEEKTELYHNNSLIKESNIINLLNINPLVYSYETYTNKYLVIQNEEISYDKSSEKINNEHYLKKDKLNSSLLDINVNSVIENIDIKEKVVIENNFIILKISSIDQKLYDLKGNFLLKGNNIKIINDNLLFYSKNKDFFLVQF